MEERKFALVMDGWLDLSWQHDFKSDSINKAQQFARETCLKIPVGCSIDLFMYNDRDECEHWGRWERRISKRVDAFAKKEPTVVEQAPLLAQITNGAGDANSG